MPLKSFIELTKTWLGTRTTIQAPKEVRAKFLLTYSDLVVGTLIVEDGVWQFEYSEDFKRNEEMRPLIEFPELDKIYRSENLWQFFAMRIPSAEQPEIEKILHDEQINENDAVGLLKRFGVRTIANPFELNMAAPL